jgi:hypothetical protein
METPIKWNSSGSRQVHTVARPRWREVRQGLVLASLGLWLFLLFAFAGLFLVGRRGALLIASLGIDPDDAIPFALIVAGAGALLGYAVVLLGQWRCLVYAPQGCGAKELQFACLLSSLAAPVCLAVGHFLTGKQFYAVLAKGLRGLAPLELVLAGGAPFLLGALLGLASGLLSAAFARAVARHLNDGDSAPGVSAYFWYVTFLLAGTGGLLVEAQRSDRVYIWPALAGAWLLGLVFHAVLLSGAARRIGRALARARSGAHPALAAPGREKGQVSLQAASYFHSKP